MSISHMLITFFLLCILVPPDQRKMSSGDWLISPTVSNLLQKTGFFPPVAKQYSITYTHAHIFFIQPSIGGYLN